MLALSFELSTIVQVLDHLLTCCSQERYFAAERYPRCKTFTPKLKRVYEIVKDQLEASAMK